MSNVIDALSKKIVERLKHYGVIEQNQEIYEFGLKELLWSIVHVINILIIGFLTNKVVYLLTIFSLYCPIRVYAGGYHANTRKGCYIGTLLLAIFMLKTMDLLLAVNVFEIATFDFMLCVVIFLLSPQESPNNPLIKEEKKKYKSNVLYVLIVESVLTILLYISGLKIILYIFFASLLGVLLIMLLGLLKLRHSHYVSH